MKILFYTIALLSMEFLCGCSSGALSEQDVILEDINQKGVDKTVQDLVLHQRWEQVLAHIETGKNQWLRLAPLLRRGTDSQTTPALNMAVARSIAVVPDQVLRYVDAPFTAEEICNVPYNDRDTTVSLNYLLKTINALHTVTDPQLQLARAKCLFQLNTMRAQLDSQ